MTIAAGLIHNEGIVLCADTQIEYSIVKTHGPKIGYFPFPDGRIAFAMAGAVAFGLSAIQKCMRVVADLDDPLSVRDVLDQTLCEEYERIVFRHPSYQTDPGRISYWFLLAIQPKGQSVTLFSTHENTMHEVRGHECIGIGGDLAHYLLGPAVQIYANEHEAVLAASQMLAKVKDHVPGCGGVSQFLALRENGTVELVDPFPYDQLARHMTTFEFMAKSLLQACTDRRLNDGEFENYIDTIRSVAQRMRTNWKANDRADPLWEAPRREAANRVVRQDSQSTTADPSPQRPSQE